MRRCTSRLADVGLPKMLEREHKAITAGLVALTAERHKKYGDTLFHLEPNIKDCPGGLRDVHVCGWLKTLADVGADGSESLRASADWPPADDEEFAQAVEFLFVVRCFLHYRHERDDNTLDWQAQDAAAKELMGLDRRRAPRRRAGGCGVLDAAVLPPCAERGAAADADAGGGAGKQRSGRWSVPGEGAFGEGAATGEAAPVGFRVEGGRAVLNAATAAAGDPAQDPDVVLQLFAAMSRTGCVLDRESEERMSQALPLLSAHLEEGPALWRHLREILLGTHAGKTLRAMHALGILELLIPEFHGIDALVIRDAYHRYTVDEHTMVLIDTLHGLERRRRGRWRSGRSGLARLLRDMQHLRAAVPGGAAARHGQGQKHGRPCARERAHGAERGRAAGAGCV